MTLYKLIARTLRHYLDSNLAAAAGIAVSTAVICGALLVGDSLQYSLTNIVEYRLGATTHTLTSGERVFTRQLAAAFERVSGYPTAAVLKSEAVLSIQGGELRLDRVALWGVDPAFAAIAQPKADWQLEAGEAVISATIAEKLRVAVGDYLMVRVKHVGPIPSNTPFVAEDNQQLSKRLHIVAIAPEKSYGQLNLQTTQTSPFNVFVNLDWLNNVMGTQDKANLLLIKASQEVEVSQLEAACRSVFSFGDLNLVVHPTENGRQILTSERVFIDDFITNSLKTTLPGTANYLTYFVNGLAFNNQLTPYSFVTALDDPNRPIGSNDMIVNEWLAKDLGLGVGDSLRMTYFVFGSLRTLTEAGKTFCVKGILPMDVAKKDSALMPYLPGLSDAGNCRDWDTGIPIDLKKIRDKDEAYWKAFKGAPKAYINLKTGQQLWHNPYGGLTTLVIDQASQNTPSVEQALRTGIDPFKSEFRINPVLSVGLDAANKGVDFSQLFAGLGMFIVAAGLLLTLLLFNLSLKRRNEQIRLYSSLGFSLQLIRKIVLIEIAGIALMGGILGLLLSIGYSKLVFWGLHNLWFDVVGTDVLSLHIDPIRLIVGAFIGTSIGIATVYSGIRRSLEHLTKGENAIKRSASGNRSTSGNRSAGGKWFVVARWVGTLLTVGLMVGLLLTGSVDNIMGWFVSGILLLATLMVHAYVFYRYAPQQTDGRLTLWLLSQKNSSRNASRSVTVVALLALGTFILVMTAANKKETLSDIHDKTGGTGGFELLAETTLPLLKDLNAEAVRTEYGIPQGVRFMQCLSAYDDDASCLNLNQVVNPRILAVQPEALAGRFRFVTSSPLLDAESPWLSLNDTTRGCVLAIADQTVIEWGLGKKVGDTLVYTNDQGKKINVVLIGGLANSIFQGNLLIAQSQFQRHFLEKGGSDFILIESAQSGQRLGKELGFAFKEYGWTTTTTREKLATFNAIENTYLNIFFLMGAFALLLGTVGLAVLIVGSLLERKKETAIMAALGFSKRDIVRLFCYEYLSLFVAGSLIGIVSAVVSTLPTFLSGNQTVPFGFVATVLAVLMANGFLWIVLSTVFLIRKAVGSDALRND